MAPKQFRQDPPETPTTHETPNGEASAPDLDVLFQEAIAAGEIEGDVVMVDEQDREVKNSQPHKTIFDL